MGSSFYAQQRGLRWVTLALGILSLGSLACGASLTLEEPTAPPAPTTIPVTRAPTATPTPDPTVIGPANAAGLAIRQTFEAQGVAALAWSEDGRTLAITADNGSTILFDIVSWMTINQSDPGGPVPTSMTWSPDGMLAFATQGRIAVIDPGRFTEMYALTGPQDNALRVDWSADGRFVAAGWFNSPAEVFDIFTREPVITTEINGAGVAFSDDSEQVAVGTQDGPVLIYPLPDGGTPRTLEGHTGEVRDVAFSHDGLYLASASLDGSVIIWDIEQGEILHQLVEHGGEVYDISWNPDGRILASGDQTGIVRLWDAATGGMLTMLTVDEAGRATNDLDFSPDGRLLATAGEGGTLLWGIGE